MHEAVRTFQDRIKNGEYTHIITTSGRRAIEDSRVIRRSALQYKVHYDTTLNGGFRYRDGAGMPMRLKKYFGAGNASAQIK